MSKRSPGHLSLSPTGDRTEAFTLKQIEGLLPKKVRILIALTIKIAATRTKPADPGYRTPDFTLVRAPSGLGLFSRDFNRSGLVQDIRMNKLPDKADYFSSGM